MQVTTEMLELIESMASQLMDIGVEPTSAIKQAASDQGVPFGEEMRVVVESVLSSLCK
jgi:Flp pilus assembly protein TadB